MTPSTTLRGLGAWLCAHARTRTRVNVCVYVYACVDVSALTRMCACARMLR